MLFGINRALARLVSPDSGSERRAATPTNPDRSGATMTLEPDHQNDSERDEPTDDRPQLVAHDVSEQHDGPLVAFYDPEGATLEGEIIYIDHPTEARR